MIKIGFIKILDTGYVTTDNAGTQASSANRANQGAEITLRVADFTPALDRNISVEPELGVAEPAEVNLGSLENMQFQLRCIIDARDTQDLDSVTDLIDCVLTSGYKILWYDFSDATQENNSGQLIFQIAQNATFGRQLTVAEAAAWTNGEQFFRLGVVFTNIQPRHVGTNPRKFDYTLRGVILPVLDNVQVPTS